MKSVFGCSCAVQLILYGKLWLVLNDNEILTCVTPESAAVWNLLTYELLKHRPCVAQFLSWVLPQAPSNSWFWTPIRCTSLKFTSFVNAAIIASIEINRTVLQQWVLPHCTPWELKLTACLLRCFAGIFILVHLTDVTSVVPDFAVGPIYLCFDLVETRFSLVFVFFG
jgi:hypothetical protein